MLTVLWENAPGCPAQRALLERVFAAACAATGAQPSVEVSVLLADDARLHALNRAYRGKDAPADVLSFAERDARTEDAGCKPALPPDEASSVSALPPPRDAGCKPALPHAGPGSTHAPPEDEEYLGDIAISLPRVHAQAAAYGHSEERELAYLFVHGFLHLLGHTHNDDTAYRHMRAREEAILNQVGLPRSGGAP